MQTNEIFKKASPNLSVKCLFFFNNNNSLVHNNSLVYLNFGI